MEGKVNMYKIKYKRKKGRGCLEKMAIWLYATRNERILKNICIKLGVTGLAMYVLALIWYEVELFVVKPYGLQNEINFQRILLILFCIVAYVVFLNRHVSQSSYSKKIVSYLYIKKKQKKPIVELEIVKFFIVLASIPLIMKFLGEEMDIFLKIFKISVPNTLIIGMVGILLILVIPLTESIFDEITYLKIDIIFSIVVCIVLIYSYCITMEGISLNDTKSVFEIVIFAIGQVSFAKTAISDYKKIYQIKIKQEETRICRHLRAIDGVYAKKKADFHSKQKI